MDRSRIMPPLCFFLAAGLSLLGALLRSCCMLTQFDADVGYLKEGFLTALCNALYPIVAAVLTISGLLIPKANSLPARLHTPYRAVAALLPGLSLAVFTAVSLIICFPTRSDNIMLAPTLLGLLASTYYFLSGRRGGRYPDWLCLLGYLPILWAVGGIAETYFDRYTAMNSPIKVTLQMGLIGFMIIVLAELRFRINRMAPRLCIVLWGIGSFACLNAGIPILLATGAGQLDHILHMLYAIVLLCAGLYGLYLLFCYTLLPVSPSAAEEEDEAPDTPSPAASAPTAE